MDTFKALMNKWGSNRIFLGLLAFLLLFGSIIIFTLEMPKQSFHLDAHLFKYVKLDQGIYYFEDDLGNTLTAYRQGVNPRITSYYDTALITYKGNTILQEMDFEDSEPYHLYLDNELIFKSDLMGVNYLEGTFELKRIEEDAPYTEEAVFLRTLVHHVMSRIDYLNQNIIFNKILMLVFTSILGLLCLIFPKKLWVLQHFLSVKEGEPTVFFLVTTRIMGVIFFLLGINGILL